MEGYSREAFDKNEEKIDKARDLAKEKTFGFRADPADVMGAKWDYIAGKQERERLIGLAQEDAAKENINRSEKVGMRIGDYAGLVVETESGNKYIIQKRDNDTSMVANFNTGLISDIQFSEISDIFVKKGEQLSLGSLGITSPVKSAKGYK